VSRRSLGARRGGEGPRRPPAGTPTTILIGCDGASCACTGAAAKSMQSTSSAAPRPCHVRRAIPTMLLLRVLVRGLGKSFIRGLHRSAVGMDYDIDESAWARLHLG